MNKESVQKKLLKVNPELKIRLDYKCPVSWEDMQQLDENDRVRFCNKCRLKVFDFVGLPATEALKIIQEQGDRLCGQVAVTDEYKIVLNAEENTEIFRGNLIADQ